ncbi:MAG: nuclear pore complex subunit [Bacteroidetes bacterium HGW-Bacteroidetes-12]|nr:MAG: nuclear pore complex subunit [Bacteroidetes bacterium HGW-Bacteroidetes-12]
MNRIEKIHRFATDVSPEVILDIEDNVFSIKGKSVVSEVDYFYQPIIDWLGNIPIDSASKMNFIFDLEYFNVFSSKRILFLLYKLKDIKERGANIKVIWYFSIEDDDMKEVGEDFACMVNLPFEFVSKQVEPNKA